MKFLYCESTEGGMDSFEFTDASLGDLLNLYEWMNPMCQFGDSELLDWMRCAKIGEYRHHRLGICIRIRGES